jgi:alkylated DNA nucleotide flippase Atl1
MRVLRTYVKPSRGAPMREVGALTLRAGLGIEGDTSARSISPRQVLLASAPVYEALALEPASLRENLLLDGHVEEWSSGQVLRIGDSVRLRLMILCEPCVKLNRVRPGLAKDIVGCRGYLARVIEGGVIRPGDRVVATGERLSPMAETPRERVYQLLRSIPHGRTVGFRLLVKTLGLPKTYVRIIPRFLKSAPADVPVHRVVTTERALITQHVPDQERLLAGEGVRVTDIGHIAPDALWDTSEYFGVEEAVAPTP